MNALPPQDQWFHERRLCAFEFADWLSHESGIVFSIKALTDIVLSDAISSISLKKKLEGPINEPSSFWYSASPTK